jgi:hypothetical protein
MVVRRERDIRKSVEGMSKISHMLKYQHIDESVKDVASGAGCGIGGSA